MPWALVILAAAGADPAVFELSAERIVHDGATRRAYAEGNAELVTEGSALHADRINWDRDTQSATAIGRVALRLTGPDLLVVVADVLTVRFEDDEIREVFVNDGKVLSKAGIAPAALRAITDPDALKTAGTTTMLMTGNHLVRDGTLWRLERLELVPCECNFESPSWSIRAFDAAIDGENHRASLWNPVVRVHGVPVLWLPWISLPLSNRQTGLLAPKPAFTVLNGVSFEQPVYITLGRSFDLTLTPGYFGGPIVPTDVLVAPIFGVQGPRLLTELRYSPSETTSGRASVGLLWDVRQRRSFMQPVMLLAGTSRGMRAEASWQHAQQLGRGWHDRVDANFVSDGDYLRDLVADVLAREEGYLRSTATVFHRGPDHWAGLDVAFRQDLTTGYPLFGRSGANLATEPRYGPNPLHRLPAITWAIPERPLLGPVSFAVQASFTRLAPTRGQSGDEGDLANEGRSERITTDGRIKRITTECAKKLLYSLEPADLACDSRPDDLQGDNVWQPGEREARQRFELLPRLSASVPLLIAQLTPYAAWRQGVWLGERTGTVTQRGHPILGARLETELARTFASARHAIAPAVELRAVPIVFGSAPAPYDETDTAIPGTSPQLQAVAELRQRLTRDGADLLRLDVGQGVQLSGASPALGETYGSLGGGYGWVSATFAGRGDATQGRVTRLSATGSITDHAGHGAFAIYENLANGGTDRSRRPLDLLFAPPVVTADPDPPVQSLSLGVYWKLWGFGLRYDALMLDPPGTTISALTLAQHSVGVSYAPACDCFRLEVSATQRGPPYGLPDFGATLTISRFGSFGISR